jgi:hypothetical protein
MQCGDRKGALELPTRVADWWPMLLGAAPTPIEVTDGVYDNNITTSTASGNVHLKRD